MAVASIKGYEIGGSGSGSGIETLDYEYFVEHEAEIRASGKTYLVKGGTFGVIGMYVIQNAEYLANKDFYDNFGGFVLITDAGEETAYNVPYKKSNVGNALDDMSSKLNSFIVDEIEVQTTANAFFNANVSKDGYKPLIASLVIESTTFAKVNYFVDNSITNNIVTLRTTDGSKVHIKTLYIKS